MLKRLIAMIRSERALPLDIRRELVDGLFYPFASLIAGALAGLWIAITVTMVVEDLLVQAGRRLHRSGGPGAHRGRAQVRLDEADGGAETYRQVGIGLRGGRRAVRVVARAS